MQVVVWCSVCRAKINACHCEPVRTLAWQSASPAMRSIACAFGTQTAQRAVSSPMGDKENGLPHQPAGWFAMTRWWVPRCTDFDSMINNHLNHRYSKRARDFPRPGSSYSSVCSSALGSSAGSSATSNRSNMEVAEVSVSSRPSIRASNCSPVIDSCSSR